tara:strand:+ start:1078 stop:1482 length:405 start_codon:yes stop_codon:yes gene_type:complete
MSLGMVTKKNVSGGFATDDVSTEPVFHDSVFVKCDASGRAASIDVTGWYHSGILLPPFGDRGGLIGHLIGPPVAQAVFGCETEVSVFHQPSRSAGLRVIIIVLKDVSEGTHCLFIGISEVVSDGAHTRSILIDP